MVAWGRTVIMLCRVASDVARQGLNRLQSDAVRDRAR